MVHHEVGGHGHSGLKCLELRKSKELRLACIQSPQLKKDVFISKSCKLFGLDRMVDWSAARGAKYSDHED